jgi:hypothetical protein
MAALLASLAACACSSSSNASGAQAAAIGAAQVQSRQSADQPRITLVERDGDPQKGVAVALHVGPHPHAAFALSLLIEGRLLGAGLEGVAAHASPSGFIVHAYANQPADVARFVSVSAQSLHAPFQPADLERLVRLWRASPPPVAGSASEAAIAQCSGEMTLPPDVDSGVPRPEELEERRAAISAGDVAFAAVGPAAFLSAASAALATLPPWGKAGAERSTLPDTDLVGVTLSEAARPNLSVALWGAPSAATVASAELLSRPGSLLALRLGAASPPWSIARVSSSLSRAGGCLRVDLQASESAPNAQALARSVRAAADEVEHTLREVKAARWDLDRQVLGMESARQAAAAAAWQALNLGFDEPRPELRRLVQYTGRLADPAGGEKLAELLSADDEAPAPLEPLRAVEAGQSDFWMLLATPCGTRGEDTVTAGTLALTMQSLARANDGHDGVRIEPWISVGAMGLLAHAGAGAASETPVQQAERVAEGLARALLAAGPTPDAIVRSRDELLGSLGEDPTPAYWLALTQSSASHPSWLEARGTWESLSNVGANSIQLQRAAFVRGRLRLASIGNYATEQIEAGEARLRALLDVASPGAAQCPPAVRSRSLAGTYRLETREQAGTSAVIAMAVPSAPNGIPEELLWTEFLMNRTGGWLEQALINPGLVSTARARALGGVDATALVIEVRAVDERIDQAVAQVRGLLARLRAGASTEGDAAKAQDYFGRYRAQRQLDPRQRIVELWRGVDRAPAGTFQGMRRLHQSLLDPEREVIVITTGER